jgi:tetratricopeptide (TPR) repeat protein
MANRRAVAAAVLCSVVLSAGVVEAAGGRDEREERLAQAEALLRRGLAIDDRDPALWRNLAEVAIARGDGAEARTLLRRARERTPPGDGYGLFQVGRLYREAGFVPEAVRAWREAEAGEALVDWGGELRAKRQWDRAEQVLLAAAELRPRDPDVHRQYALVARFARGGPDGAIRELQRLAALESASPWPHVELARLFDEQGRTLEAQAARAAAAQRGVP